MSDLPIHHAACYKTTAEERAAIEAHLDKVIGCRTLSDGSARCIPASSNHPTRCPLVARLATRECDWSITHTACTAL